MSEAPKVWRMGLDRGCVERREVLQVCVEREGGEGAKSSARHEFSHSNRLELRRPWSGFHLAEKRSGFRCKPVLDCIYLRTLGARIRHCFD